MMTGVNAFLLTAATVLVPLGTATIKYDLITGLIEILVGAGLFVLYEKLPVSK